MKEGATDPAAMDYYSVMLMGMTPNLFSIYGKTDVQRCGSSTSVMDFRFDQLLPDNGLDYWYYQGSLTASPALQ